MKLLFLNHNFRRRGTYYRAMPLAQHLAQRGHQVTLFTVSRDCRWRVMKSVVDGVCLIEAPNLALGQTAEGYGLLDNVVRFAHACSHRYDIVHMFDHKPNATLPGFPARSLGARLVADWADWWGGPGGVNDIAHRRLPLIGWWEQRWEERSKLWADGVVTISRVLQQRALELGCSPERVLVLPTGAPVERIMPIAAAQARAALGIPPERQLVGFIGLGQGDLDIVMRALAQLPDVWLMVLGELSPTVTKLARDIGVADRLWQTGFVPDADVGRYLGCADVMCLPLADRAANRGRLPNKLLDYMAAGRPTVASPVGDVAEIIRAHDIGLLADDRSFAGALAQLLADEPLRLEMGRRARAVAESEYAWPALIDRLEGFYASLLHKAGGSHAAA